MITRSLKLKFLYLIKKKAKFSSSTLKKGKKTPLHPLPVSKPLVYFFIYYLPDTLT